MLRGGGGGEYQIGSWKCWEQIFKPATRPSSGRSRKESGEERCCSLAASEKQGQRRTRRGKASSVGRTMKNRYFENCQIYCNYDKKRWNMKTMSLDAGKWKQVHFCSSLHSLSSCQAFIFFTPQSFFLQIFLLFSLHLVAQPFATFANFCCVNNSQPRRANPFEASFQYHI